MDNISEYGLWGIVITHSLFILFLVFCFFRPQTRRDWRTFGAFSAFVIALFTEMYGFPLTIYLLSGWLSSRFPAIDWLSHDAGHLLINIIGWEGDPHFGLFHLVSEMMVIGGLVLLAFSWKVLYRAQQDHRIAMTGPYARMRHPQYSAFMIIMVGYLIQWPTLITLAMFPVLVFIYIRLARREERQAFAEFGEQYTRYAENTPRFFPKLWGIKTSFENSEFKTDKALSYEIIPVKDDWI